MKNLYLLLATLLIAFSVSGQTISGTTSVCVGEWRPLYGMPTGGTWSISAGTGVATISSSTGIYTGVTAGTATVTYTLGASSSTEVVTINPAPAPITGPSTVCEGSTITLSSTPTGGTWVSDPITVGAIGSSSGVLTGVTAGTTTITYITPAGCIPTKTVTVNPLPAAIFGPSSVCTGSTITLTCATAGGMWTDDVPAVATVDMFTGTVTGLAIGGTTVTYTLPGTGCYRIHSVSVNPTPSAISGPSTVCLGSAATLTSSPGAMWTSSDVTVATVTGVGSTTGAVTAITLGTTMITYGTAMGCYTTYPMTVNPTPGPITGPSTVCEGASITLSSALGGGTWSNDTAGSVAYIDPSTGVLTGFAAGTNVVSYVAPTGCFSLWYVTVNTTPGLITGISDICAGSSATAGGTPSGGTWASSATSVATITSPGGIVTGGAAGTSTISYTLSTGCMRTMVLTVNPSPTISVSSAPSSCGPLYTATATGATTYSWAPTTGISSGGSSAVAYIYAGAPITYTVTGTSAGCSGTATLPISANRILGHLSFSGPAPSGTSAKVWLVQYNTIDSSIIATDSMLTCLDGGNPYYEFSGKPAGDYLVKAKLLSSVAGTSDYMPTYGTSAATWDLATPVTHAAASDSLNIGMIYGTVPSGPGFISGYVYMGAGKGTSSEVPAPGMILYLKNATTGAVLTYTYTDATGAYSFGSLAYGSYIIYPEEMSYNTIPSAVITLSAGSPSAGPTGFKKRTTAGTIEPWTKPAAVLPVQGTEVCIYPNPANDMVMIANAKDMNMTITDATGRQVYTINITSEQQPVNVAALPAGLYMVSVGKTVHVKLIKQ